MYYVPATNVTDTTVGGCTWNSTTNRYDCDSLRLAIDAANAAGSGDIVLDAATYEVSISGAENINAQGDFDFYGIGASYSLSGVGELQTFIDATILRGALVPDRVLDVQPLASLQVSDLQIRRGYAESGGGGGVRNRGTIIMERVTVYDNESHGLYTFEGGGGVNNSGTATLVDCQIDDNLSTESPGGGIFSSGSLVVDASGTAGQFSIIARNVAAGTSGGGMAVSGPTTVEDTDIGNNEATDLGGGVWLFPSSTAVPIEFHRSSFNENKTTLAHGPAGSPWNTSAGGGGIAANDTTTALFEQVSVTTNGTAGFGGGVYTKTPIGGTSSTILDFRFVSFYSNASSSTLPGFGGNTELECGGGTCRLESSLVWGICSSGVAIAAGHQNIEDDAKGAPTCGFANFGPLGTLIAGQAGGNQTVVVQLQAGSAAINLVSSGSCPNLPDAFDQRGLSRAAKGPCDMGAFER